VIGAVPSRCIGS